MSVPIVVDMNLSVEWILYEAELSAGALVVVEETRCRVRILPL
jgi:hypothetical protein